MKDYRNLLGICLLLAVNLLLSCDTTKNIDDPNKSYFIKYYGNDGDQEGVDVAVGSDGSIYILGNTTPPGSPYGTQLYLVKTDEDGKLIWEKTFGGQYDEQAKDLELTLDNRLIVLASTKKGSAENDILIMSVSPDGAKLDSIPPIGLKTISNEEADDVANSISLTSDGFIISGTTTSVNSKGSGGILPEDTSDALQIRLNSDLTIFKNWTATNGTIGSDGSVKIYQVSPSLFYVFGYSNIDIGGNSIKDFNFWIYPLGVAGDIASGQQMYPGAVITDEKLSSAVVSPPQAGDGFFLAGTSSDPSGNYDVFINKLRKTLSFNVAADYQINKPLSIPLGKLDDTDIKVSVFASQLSGYFLLTNQKSTSINNFYLTKIDNNGGFAWSSPQSLVYGGQKNNDHVGAVAELPDGKIILVGTMSIGDEGQKKMALIKVNGEGKFLE